MRVSYSWLQDYLDIDISPEELAQRLTLAGIEVDEIQYIGEDVSDVVVAKVLEKAPHPSSKKLSVCQVDNGSEVLTVVCGAPNVEAGQKVPLALPGAVLPGGINIGKAVVAGVESSGMICSGAELGINEFDKDGIMVLSQDLSLGMDIIEALGIKDAVLLLDLTPNRSDCLGMLNVAREVAAITEKLLKPQFIQYPEKGADINSLATVEVLDPGLCPRYVVRLVQGVKIAPSPIWMQRYLLAAGMRPINNVVDISNFVLLETGQPLHTFDYQTLAGHKIIVRRSRQGERMTTLDDKNRIFDDNTILICDAQRPICIAGVMGGVDTEVTEKTVDILIESAAFNPVNIRRTARGLGIPSEASLRFEKGIDIENCDRAAKRAAQLLVDICGGTAARGLIDVRAGKSEEKRIILRPQKVNDYLGSNYNIAEIAKVMSDLSFPVENHAEGILVTVPHYRRDITLEVDLIEEVARLKGYDNIPAVLPAGSASCGKRSDKQKNMLLLKNMLAGLGLSQVINYSFINDKEPDKLLLPADHAWRRQLAITNPLSEEQAVMRTSLLPGLLSTVNRNYNHRNLDLQLFEIGQRFYPQGEGQQPHECEGLGIALSGSTTQGWNNRSKAYDYFYLKGIIEYIMDGFGINDYDFAAPDAAAYPFLHPGCSAILSIDGQDIGYVGELHPLVGKNYDLEERAMVAEISLLPLFAAIPPLRQCRDLPKYPAVTRDISLLGSADVSAALIEATIREQGGEFLSRVELFDLYDKEPIPQGLRSLAYALTFQNYERTLTDEEVNKSFEAIVACLKERWNINLR